MFGFSRRWRCNFAVSNVTRENNDMMGGSSMRASEACVVMSAFPIKAHVRAIKGFQRLLLYTSNFSVVTF
jgi:hypothetical protein